MMDGGIPIVGQNRDDVLETAKVKMPNDTIIEVPLVVVCAFSDGALFQLQAVVESTLTAVLNKRAVAAAVKGKAHRARS